MSEESAERIKVACACGVKLALRASAIGHRVRCPKCNESFIFTGSALVHKTKLSRAKAQSLPETSSTGGDQPRVAAYCFCGAKYRIPASTVGRKYACPRCGKKFIASTAGTAKPAAPAAVGVTAPRSLFDELADEEQTAEAIIRMPEEPDDSQVTVSQKTAPPVYPGGPVCPSCKRSFPTGTAICVSCGVNLKTGRTIITVQDADEDAIYATAERVVRWLSWLIWMGIYPIASEGFGTSKPYVIRAIAIITILVSGWFFMQFLSDSPEALSHMNLMLWAGRLDMSEREPMPAEQNVSDRSEASDRRDDTAENGEVDSADAPVADLSLFQYRPSQLITSAFLHGGLIHLASNMLFLLVIGSRINALIGNIATTVVYLLLAVIAGLFYLAANAHEPLHPALGASGAIMGLSGMYLVLMPLHKVHMVAWYRLGLIFGFRLGIKLFATRGFWVLLFYIAFDVFYTAMDMETGTAHWAHLGGFIGGIVIGMAMLILRLVNCRGGDILSVTLGPRAWAIIGRPGGK